MAKRLRTTADRLVRAACVVFAVALFVLHAPAAVRGVDSVQLFTFGALAVLVFALSQLHIPLLALHNFGRRATDLGSFVLDGAIFAFAFVTFGWYAAAILHVAGSMFLLNLRLKYTPLERLLRTAPGVVFWYLAGFFRPAFGGVYLRYSFEGLAAFFVLMLALHAAYVFAWFDSLVALRTGQRITRLWRAQISDVFLWGVVAVQWLWGYAAVEVYRDAQPLLAIGIFLPLPLIAMFLRREHRHGIEYIRISKCRLAYEAVLAKGDARPYVRDLLMSVQSDLFDETLAIVVSTPSRGRGFELIEQSGPLELSDTVATSIEAALLRLREHPELRCESGDAWAAYPIRSNAVLLGTLLIYRNHELSEPIARPDFQSLADDLTPVIRNLNEIAATQYAANTDGLTGVLNRSGLETYAATGRSGRFGIAMMLDIDCFKLVNDNHGHLRGDEVLRAVAGILKEYSRESDVVARYGGDEFLMLLSEPASADALAIAERIRITVDSRIETTVSLGIAIAEPSEAVGHIIARADRALYAAKRAGRDRCVLAQASQDCA